MRRTDRRPRPARPADTTRPVRALSAGRRRELEPARLGARPLDLLLLDEPTNHLAPAVVEELEAALTRVTGTLITVTHDRPELAPEDQPVVVSR
ncbi:hypothetical protein MTF65_05665 [Streptomyces sp. APSN-46.1]|uniref:hypothetical protein n=1 Tax=Streptomyces sp. APSN-46.1 TaxID=2929049 RepID=UPI001FB209D6|nr:hypothetical protein [Streptomyces sp. APSN-46.1]MCJ1676844.1 hypothetical protein [Streptomyces sp. APSN-46.1]